MHNRMSQIPSGEYDGDTQSDFSLKLVAAGIIFIVSAAAASFPTLAKRAPRIEPPEIVFFITKHFGTGVILATAFVHLLQEAFESLTHPAVSGGWKELTGFIVLLSFLLIFLVEYISTAIVERISGRHPHGHHHHHPSSSIHIHREHVHEHEHEESSEAFGSHYYDEPEEEPLLEGSPVTTTPTITPTNTQRSRRSIRDRRTGSHMSLGHHRHESPHAHHHKVAPRLVERQHIPVLYIPEPAQGEAPVCVDIPILYEHHSVDQQEISRKTRIISILVLQLGIMVHSVVIGLTLSITQGAGFTTLLTAVAFHQLFEGLSLGIRISTLPDNGSGKHRLLPVVLCGLFAITAPLGLLLGVAVFPSSPLRQGQGSLSIMSSSSQFPIYYQQISPEAQSALLIRGLMCSLSAGMLIYASAVEMLAGDFVMSAELRQLTWVKQAIALFSLLLGTCAMSVIGIWL